MKWSLNTSQYDINAGQRAFIYQQLMEFTPWMLAESSAAVDVNPCVDPKNPDEVVSVTITLTHDGTNISASADDADVITAAKDAKEKLLDFLYQVQQEVTSNEKTGS